MASTDKGKYVVLFTSGNFIFFKHKNDKGIFCPKSILNSPRQVLKDDIYELVTESVTTRHHKDYPDMPEAAVLIATKAKFLKTPRVIHGMGTMKKISQDGEYGFIEYQDGRTPITAFCTRITVRPLIDKGGMNKFFTTGGKVRFVAKEQPPSGMFNIEWRVVTATDMRHEICESNWEKVTPVSATVPVARPAAAAAAVASPPAAARPAAATTVQQPTVASLAAAAAIAPPPGLPPMAAAAAAPQSNGVSASSSSSSVVNGVSFAARASQQLTPTPEAIANVIHAANSGAFGDNKAITDDNLPTTCPIPAFFRLSDQEKLNNDGGVLYSSSVQLRTSPFVLKEDESSESLARNMYDVWPHYKKGTADRWLSNYDEERSLEAFEAELCQLSRVATSLYGGDSHLFPISFASRVS
ncbi:hypothetical protein PENTCL1PPCAC_13203 [Pristionchus entomophagus]|uniref:Uncharacterized protein n=1 Tax=Pristionchus entomophagus TaxID=358040 RepID=A0AAV5TAA9_9BILA|nr:hypothetical protein PENTCL1PPCAC_13203 [Pristionchus entomophagus]